MNKIYLDNKLRRFFTRFGGGGIKTLGYKETVKVSDEDSGKGTINFDELAEKFRNFYIYPKKDKARFFQDGVDGEYDIREEPHPDYQRIKDNAYIADEFIIVGTANVEDYFEVSDIEVLKLLVAGLSIEAYNTIGKLYTDTLKFLVPYSTKSIVSIETDRLEDNEEHSVGICYEELSTISAPSPAFGVVLTPEDCTKFYVLDTSLAL